MKGKEGRKHSLSELDILYINLIILIIKINKCKAELSILDLIIYRLRIAGDHQVFLDRHFPLRVLLQ